MSFWNPFGDKKTTSSNTTQQTDARTVTDYSGANVGQTVNIYGADAATMQAFLKGNQQASPYGSSAQAVGMPTGGEGVPTGSPLSPMVLALGGVLLLAVLMRR
jgi:hypothetical protein